MKFVKDHPIDQIIGEPSNRVQTRSFLKNISNLVFLSQTEPKNINEALDDINADIEELLKILEDKAQENKSRSEINRKILHKRKF